MAGKLTALGVKALSKPGRYGDGGGLYLQVRDAQHRSWLFRYKIDGQARHMGLGATSDVSLAEARIEAEKCRQLLRDRIDPLESRKSKRAESARTRDAAISFQQAAEQYIELQRPGWRNAVHAEQWANTLHTYVFPRFGDVAVAKVDTSMVMQVLQPIWPKKTETASRIRGRIEAVLNFAKARGWRTGENPALWRGHLSMVLPAPRRVAPVKHHPALPYTEMRAFMHVLATMRGTAVRALEFTILTTSRSEEALGARWCEINISEGIWIVPASRMKAKKTHHVPLSVQAIAVLQRMSDTSGNVSEFVFPGAKPEIRLSNMAMAMVLRRMNRRDITVHGFRSSFRDWSGDETQVPREVAEAQLAHTLDKTEAAYRRGTAFAQRRGLVQDWADYCMSGPPYCPFRKDDLAGLKG